MMFKSIETLPIWHFIKINETNDLKYLNRHSDIDSYIDSTPNSKAAIVYEKIEAQYHEATKHRRSNQDILDVFVEIAELKITFESIQQLTFLMQLGDESSIYKINDYGYNFNAKTCADADRIRRQSKNIITKIAILESELTKMIPKKSAALSFEKIVDIIEDFKKRPIDAFTISVKKWIVIEDSYLKSIEKLNH